VRIPEYRQRKEIDGERLSEIMDSITKNGLIHPIVVREGNLLVVGERRLKAIRNLGDLAATYRFGTEDWDAAYIPAVDFGTLDPLAAEEAELEENVCRVDLTLQERIAATGRLADLRRRQAVVLGRPVPTLDEIAREVRPAGHADDREDTRRELILSAHLGNPEIARSKTLKEAWDALKRSEQVTRNIELARTVGLSYGKDAFRLVNQECVAWMKEQPGEQFDVILTDPPYGIDAQDFGDADGRLRSQTHLYDDSLDSWRTLLRSCSREWYRVAKQQAHLYCCCDIDRFVELKQILGDDGWECHRTPIINYKRDGARVPWPSWGPQRKYELILYAMKGRKPVTRIYPDVIETTGDENLGAGAQKPAALFSDLLRRSVRPGDNVLDTFAGTGTIFVAAAQAKCFATGVEVDQNYFGISAQRIADIEL
jgi:DNA modification methylase/ParB-like chromosome segregation protein Spo0J